MSSAYGSRWNAARTAFLRANPLCVMCSEAGKVCTASVVDHIVPHRLKDAHASGDPNRIAAALKLFWDRKNWQPLCESHHNATKQRAEKRGYEQGCDAEGIPLDPGHHWR